MKQPSEGAMTAAAAELRALIREAHEAAQALRDAIKAGHAQVEEYAHDEIQRAMDTYTTQMQAACDGWAADARADAQRVLDSVAYALAQAATVIEMDMQATADTPPVRAAIVVDLTTRPPQIAVPDTDQAREMLAKSPVRISLRSANDPPAPRPRRR